MIQGKEIFIWYDKCRVFQYLQWLHKKHWCPISLHWDFLLASVSGSNKCQIWWSHMLPDGGQLEQYCNERIIKSISTTFAFSSFYFILADLTKRIQKVAQSISAFSLSLGYRPPATNAYTTTPYPQKTPLTQNTMPWHLPHSISWEEHGSCPCIAWQQSGPHRCGLPGSAAESWWCRWETSLWRNTRC